MQQDASQKGDGLSGNLSQLRAVRKFVSQDSSADITSIHFNDDGDFLLSASEAAQELRVWDVEQCQVKRKLYVKEYGIGIARFTHRHSGILHSSTMKDNNIRYLFTHDNKYIRIFQGHKSRVTAMEMSPLNDQFLSAAVGDSVRLWDLRTPNCQGLLDIKEGQYPIIGWDPSGLVFGLSIQYSDSGPADLRLYDSRAYNKGPFSTWYLGDDLASAKGLQFSPNSKYILLHTSIEAHVILDAYSGKRLGMANGEGQNSFAVSWAPDSESIVAGSNQGKVNIFNVTGELKASLKSTCNDTTTGVAFNPQYWMMMTVHGSDMAFWNQLEAGEPD